MTRMRAFVYLFLSIVCVFLITDRYSTVYMGAIVCLAGINLVAGLNKRIYFGVFGKFYGYMIGLLMVSLVLSMFPSFSELVSQTVIIKELLRCLLHIMLLTTFCTMQIDISRYKKIWYSMDIVVISIAILQYIKVFDIDSLLVSIYGHSGQFFNSQMTTLDSFRCGSVFVNPNDFAAYLVASLSVYLYIQRTEPDKRVFRLAMYSLFIIAFVLSGSRSGMLLGATVVCLHLYSLNDRNVPKLVAKAISFLPLIILGMGIIVAVYGSRISSVSNLRMFQVTAGLENSVGIKINNLTRLFSKANIINFFFGFGPYDYSGSYELSMDFDIGYFLAFFGGAGIVGVCILFSSIRRIGVSFCKNRKSLSDCFLIIALFFGMTAGVYFNLRLFSVYLAMFLPMLRKKDATWA